MTTWKKLKPLMTKSEIKWMERYERLGHEFSVAQKAADKAWDKFKAIKGNFPQCLRDSWDCARKERIQNEKNYTT